MDVCLEMPVALPGNPSVRSLRKIIQRTLVKKDSDTANSNQRLIEELDSLRRKIARLEKAEVDRRMRSARQESEEKYRNLVESTRDLIFIVSKEGTYTYVNPQFERITGYSVRDLIGRPFTFLVAPEHVEATISGSKRDTGEDTPPYEADLVHRSGERIPSSLW